MRMFRGSTRLSFEAEGREESAVMTAFSTLSCMLFKGAWLFELTETLENEWAGHT